MTKKAGTLILLIALAIGSQARDKVRLKTYYNYTEAKELKKLLPAAKSNIDKISILSNLAVGYWTNSDPANIDTVAISELIRINGSARILDDAPYRDILAALKAGKQHNFITELALFKQAVEEFDSQGIEAGNLLLTMRWVFNVANMQEDKLRYYSQKFTYYLQNGLQYSAGICQHCIAGYYAFKEDYNSAINSYLKAGDLLKPVMEFWYINELMVAGTNYSLWGNSERAIFYLKKGLRLERYRHYTDDISFALYSLAEVEYDNKHYGKSLAYLDTLSAFINSTKIDTGDIPNSGVLKALNYTALAETANALKELNYLEREDNASAINKASHIGQLDLDYAWYKYYLAINEMPAAEKYLLKAYKKSISNTSNGLKLLYLRELAKFYGNQNNTADAWKYTILYNRANDSLQHNINGFKIASFENEQKENAQNKKLIELQQQRAIQDATIKQRTIIIWLSLLGFVLVCGSLVFMYRQLRVNKKTLINLRKTQRQLIQSEKMASLGELTAGIAHEIQNPLNFVNNFSEVSIEMLDEMKLELKAGKAEDALDIAGDIEQNLEKIIHHGKRADGIVKGMLQHSRAGSNTKEPTDINELADEYFRLAFHGLRAKDKTFNSDLVTHFDENLPMINVVPQDIGRVLLNLFTNAFYSVQAKQKTAGSDYKPVVELSTTAPRVQQDGTKIILIKVKDNGGGIPEHIRHKIMQPFFTTKPTGEGTGLGLSMSYDIVVKEHGGNIDVTSKENEYAEFTISLRV